MNIHVDQFTNQYDLFETSKSIVKYRLINKHAQCLLCSTYMNS